MKQADIETMAQEMPLGTDPFPYPGMARKVANQLTGDIGQLFQHIEDNPDWWEAEVSMPDVEDTTHYPTCLRDVLCELIFEVAYNACRRCSGVKTDDVSLRELGKGIFPPSEAGGIG